MKTCALACCAVLTGCDLVNSTFDTSVKQSYINGAFKEPSIVISPGWQISDHGNKAVVFGTSNCPDSNGKATKKEGCVIIDAQSATVAVFVVDPSAQLRRSEVWKIERKGDVPTQLTRFKRPDNSYVVAWGS